jgi:hypothetical protein
LTAYTHFRTGAEVRARADDRLVISTILAASDEIRIEPTFNDNGNPDGMHFVLDNVRMELPIEPRTLAYLVVGGHALDNL